jgi:hypothetical protein
MSLDKEQYEDAALKEKYLSVMTDTLAKVHPNKDARNRAGVLAAQILELEIQTSTILPSLDEFQDPEVFTRLSP